MTKAGIDFISQHPEPLPKALLATLAAQNIHVPLAKRVIEVIEPSPTEALENALEEIRQATEASVLEQLLQVSPAKFESIVLDLLHRLGYGGDRSDLQRVGGPGDAGIDGVIALDALGLEKVYVQAKRWQGRVGRAEIQAFYGALAGQRSNRGVFITTSDYSPQAQEFARSVQRIVLVDGSTLSALMVKHEVGVTARTLKIPRLDTDYFEDT